MAILMQYSLYILPLISCLGVCLTCDQLFNFIADQFGLKSRSFVEINAIKSLFYINQNTNEFYGEYNLSQTVGNYFHRKPTNFVVNSLKRILDVVGFANLYLSVRDGVSTAVTCLTCHSLSTLIFNDYLNKETVALALHEVCIALHLSTPRVCVGLIDQMTDHVDFIRKRSKLSPAEVCGILMGSQCFIGRSEHIFWRINIPTRNESRISNLDTIRGQTTQPIRILQLTDIHLDLDYQFGADVRCSEPLCCRHSVAAANESAGKWGSYPCDIPLQTVDNVLAEIDSNSKMIDMWYWTGDIVAHDIWQYSRTSNMRHSQLLTDLFHKYTNEKPIIPVIGNHETVPVNCFPPPSIKGPFSISWLYDTLAEQWSQWLPSSAVQSFKYAGYYTAVVNSRFRVLVVNTNYCARLNIWTYYDPVDPGHQLSWLVDQLLAAEEVGAKVHIVGHVPVDDRECTQAYVFNYLAIVERFSDTIVGQFFGHTHADEFRVLYSNDNKTKPIGFEILSPSLTTFDSFNPAYRIVTVRGDGVIEDMDTYIMNLTDANRMTETSARSSLWSYEYSMKSEYDLQDINGEELNQLFQRLATNDSDLQKFYSFYYRFSDQLKNECNDVCREKFIDDIYVANPFDKNPKSVLKRG